MFIDEKLYRAAELLGNPKAEPPRPALIPVSVSTFYGMVADGRLPPGRYLGPACRVWSGRELNQFLNELIASDFVPANRRKPPIRGRADVGVGREALSPADSDACRSARD
ncbi:helix-turn-helix transcriptional regulator [Pseudoxanthomonas mexicana]|uniref:helix-turn-helix transcriptional regulator n=1 Tax=Pseudoxanthomonas mexicana TaxID=128785 RepID=UPI0024E20A95|nr:hypothetical protein [Pseudoxanthomonas mexicana]